MTAHPGQVIWEPFSREKNLENVRSFYENEAVCHVLGLENPAFIIGAFDGHICDMEYQ